MPKPIRKSSSTIIPARVAFSSERLEGNMKVEIQKQVVPLTHLQKVYWPKEGYTKGDLLQYYYAVSKYILPYLKNRPLILKRYPEGITKFMFYQHNLEDAPEFIRTVPIKMKDKIVNYSFADDTADL